MIQLRSHDRFLKSILLTTRLWTLQPWRSVNRPSVIWGRHSPQFMLH